MLFAPSAEVILNKAGEVLKEWHDLIEADARNYEQPIKNMEEQSKRNHQDDWGRFADPHHY